jgi:23S rRNA pseudouridine2605 synthase
MQPRLVAGRQLCYQPVEHTGSSMSHKSRSDIKARSRTSGVAIARASPGREQKGERVAKVVARAGLGSRREAEGFIAAGRVAVNGAVIASPALNVTARDTITIDGKPLPTRERTRLFLYHKPRGLMTARLDPQGRRTIFDALPRELPRLISIGRLDFNTEGLLLLTNDGGLARVLELPETGWLRRYRVRAHGAIAQDALDRLADGITVEGVRYGPIEAKLDRPQGSNVWLTFAMREGKNREIRNVLGALGLEVNRLIRVSFGPFQLGDLKEGRVDVVKTRTLREQIGERIAAQAGADFAAPLIERDAERREKPRAREGDRPAARQSRGRDRRDDQPSQKEKRQNRPDDRHGAKRSDHVWRDRAPREDAPRGKRAGLVADRKGRRIPVVRGDAPPRPRRKR